MEMTRRQFLLALAAAIWAGPRAVRALIERHRQLRQLDEWPLGLVDVITSSSVHGLKTYQPYYFGIDPRAIERLKLRNS